MYLSDISIKEYIDKGGIVITPYDEDLVQAASIDLRLGKDFMTYIAGSHEPVISTVGRNIDNAINYERVICNKNHPYFYIYPNQFVLGTTMETIGMPTDLIGHLQGKSSLGRVGLMVHIAAGYVQPGFKGELTIELLNMTNRPIKLIPGMAISQLSFEMLDCPCERPYGSDLRSSRYQNQTGATPADFTPFALPED